LNNRAGRIIRMRNATRHQQLASRPMQPESMADRKAKAEMQTDQVVFSHDRPQQQFPAAEYFSE
jgi:hypothetical protein